MKIGYFWSFEGESSRRLGEIDVEMRIEKVEHPKCNRRTYDREEAKRRVLKALRQEYGDDKRFEIEFFAIPLIVPKYYYTVNPGTGEKEKHLNV